MKSTGGATTPPRVKRETLSRLACHGVVGGNRAALFNDLARGVETNDSLEPRTVEVALRGCDVPLERCPGRSIRFDNDNKFTARRALGRRRRYQQG